jgi:hypothetical protein
MLARQVLQHLSHTASHFCFSYFLNRVWLLCPGWLGQILARIASISHHVQLHSFKHWRTFHFPKESTSLLSPSISNYNWSFYKDLRIDFFQVLWVKIKGLKFCIIWQDYVSFVANCLSKWLYHFAFPSAMNDSSYSS